MSRPFPVPRFPGRGIDPHPRRKAHTGRLGTAVGLFPLRGYPSLSAPESGTATAPLCGQLAGVSLRLFVFFAPGGYRCRGIPGMAKPPSTPKGARQRTDTGFSRLSWTHPIRAETGFLPFRGGGVALAATSAYTRKGYSRKGFPLFSPLRPEDRQSFQGVIDTPVSIPYSARFDTILSAPSYRPGRFSSSFAQR